MLANIKILLVDDQELVRTAFRLLLEKQTNIKIIAEANSGEQALKIAKQKKPDIVIMDIQMPGIGGLAAIQRLRAASPGIKIIALTTYNEGFYPEKILNQLANDGLLTKECGAAELLEAIEKVYQGKPYIGAKIAQKLAIDRITFQHNDLTEEQTIIKALAAKEFEVFLLISTGLSIAEVSKKLSITAKTVNTYRYRIYKKLNLQTDVQLAHAAIRHKIIAVEPSTE